MAEHNGWKNYETWCLKLWIDEDVHSYRYWQHAAHKALTEGYKGEARDILAQQLEKEIDKQAPRLRSLAEKQEEQESLDLGFYSDILSASILAIDYEAIAERLLKDAKTGRVPPTQGQRWGIKSSIEGKED